MASTFESPELMVFGEYFPADELTVASFVWPDQSVINGYTIAPNTGLSLELDRQYPVRIGRIALYDRAALESEQLLVQLTSNQLSEELLRAPRTGYFVASFQPTLLNRLQLARLQATNPSTPPAVRRACVAMLRANRALFIEQIGAEEDSEAA